MTADVLLRVADCYKSEAGGNADMLRMASRELHRLASCPPQPELPLRLPVCRHLPAALAQADNGPLASIAAAFGAIEPLCRWRQNASYTRSNVGAAFLENYGYAELVGPGRMWPCALISVGFLLLGPHTHYPAHRHPAAEIYHVVAGDAEWRQGSGPFAVQRAGAAIHHAPGVDHEMRTAAQPLLALYCWMGDLEVAARLS